MADSKANTRRKKTTGSTNKVSKRKTSKKKTVAKSRPATSTGGSGSQEVKNTYSKSPAEASHKTHVAEKTVQQKRPGDVAVATASKDQSAASSSVTGQGNSAITWLSLVMSVAALVAGGYAWYLVAVDSRINAGQQQNKVELLGQRIDGFEGLQSDLGARISLLKTQMAESETEFSNGIRNIRNAIDAQDNSVREQIDASRKTLSEQTTRFREEFDALSGSIVKLRSELNRGIDSWTLEEIEQLVIIADQRLRFAGDIAMAIEALELANRRLDQLADPSLVELRQQVVADIKGLSAVPVVDVVEILGSIDALGDSVHGLALAGDIKSPDPGESGSQSDPETGQDSADDEQSSFDRYTQPLVDASTELLASLADLIQVEKNGQSLKPVVSDHTRQLIYERTRLLLESAQVALVRQEDILYQDRLKRVREWVTGNFDNDSVRTRDWLDQLSEIESQSTVSDLPDISGSVNAVRKAIGQQ